MLISDICGNRFFKAVDLNGKTANRTIEGRFRQLSNFAYLGADEINVALKVCFKVRFVTHACRHSNEADEKKRLVN